MYALSIPFIYNWSPLSDQIVHRIAHGEFIFWDRIAGMQLFMVEEYQKGSFRKSS